jgi:hypothetical protein
LWQALFHPHAGVREKIELVFGHPIMMRGAVGLSKNLDMVLDTFHRTLFSRQLIIAAGRKARCEG